LQTNHRELKEKIQRNHTLIAGMKTAFAAESKKNGTEAIQARRTAALESKAKHQTMLDKIEREIPIIEAALKDIYEERSQCQQQIEEAMQNRQAAQERVQQIQGNLNALRQRQGSGDPLAAFGRNLRAVYQAIDRTQWVHSKPIGPLGMHVSIKTSETRYQKLLDVMLSSSLTSWAVRDSRDKRTLLNIFQQCIARAGT
jgi:chromosome segregation ATPase